MSREERLKILEMLAEKKISVEEAERLLKALEKPKGLGEFSQRLFREIKQALQSIPHPEVDQITNQVVQQVGQMLRWAGSTLDGTDEDQQIRVPSETSLTIHHGGGNLLVHAVEGEELVLSGARRGCSLDAENRQMEINAGGSNLAVGIPGGIVRLNVSMGGGNVSLRGLKLQELRAKTAGGNVTLEEITSPTIHLSTMGGNLTLRQMQTSTLEARALGGNVSVDVQAAEGGILDLHSIGGDVELRLPADASFRVEAETLGGRFSSEFELEEFQSHGGRAQGRIGDGELNIRIRTKGGNARIRRKEQSGQGAGGV